MARSTVHELHALSEAIIEAGPRSFLVRRVLDPLEAGELSLLEAVAVLKAEAQPNGDRVTGRDAEREATSLCGV